jgi:hypothetical protein
MNELIWFGSGFMTALFLFFAVAWYAGTKFDPFE